MAEEKKESGWLKKAFWGAAKLVTIGVASAVAWQLFLDPLFFAPIHDVTNVTAQAWVGFMQDKFGWIPDMTGMTGDGGLLKTEFAQNILSPYASQVAVPSGGMITDAVANTGGAITPDIIDADVSNFLGGPK